MVTEMLPSIADIRRAFQDELGGAGGKVSDVFDDGVRLFMRGVLPAFREVRAEDRVQGGVALMAVGSAIEVYPYTFRQVCRNGAIVACAIEAQSIQRVEPGVPEYSISEITLELRETIRACCGPAVFAAAAGQMRMAAGQAANMAINLMPLVAGAQAGNIQVWGGGEYTFVSGGLLLQQVVQPYLNQAQWWLVPLVIFGQIHRTARKCARVDHNCDATVLCGSIASEP